MHDFIALITDTFGVEAGPFLMVSATVLVLSSVIRRYVRLSSFGEKAEKSDGWKAALTALPLALGVGAAFAAQSAALYQCPNAITIVWVGFWNGALSMIKWHFLKRIGSVRLFVAGSL